MTTAQRALVGTLALGIFLCLLDTTVMNIALPEIQTGLHVSLTQLSWALNAYTILFACLTIPLGRVADLWDQRKLYLVGLGLFLLGSLGSSTATSLVQLVGGRIGQSLGAAIVFPLSMTLALQRTPRPNHTTVISVLGVTQGLAAALGPTLGGLLTQWGGWRAIFAVNLPLTLMALGLSGPLLRRVPRLDARSRHLRLDIGGTLLSILALVTFTLALVNGQQWGWMSWRILGLEIVSLLAAGGFVWAERHVAQPMVPLDLFRNRDFTGAAVITLVAGIFFVGVLVLMPSFFTRVQGTNALTAALLITPASVMVFIWSPISGFLLAKLGARRLVVVGEVCMVLGYGCLTVLTTTDYRPVLVGLLLVGSGYGIIIGPSTVLAASDFRGEQLTASQSVIGVIRQLGTLLAIAIFVSTLSTSLGTAKQQISRQATATLTALPVSTAVRQHVLTQLHQQLAAETPRTTGVQITSAQQRRLTRQAEQRLIHQRHLERAPRVVRQKVRDQVANRVAIQVSRVNRLLARAMTAIKLNVRQHLTTAFRRPFQWALPVICLTPLAGFFFKRPDPRPTSAKAAAQRE